MDSNLIGFNGMARLVQDSQNFIKYRGWYGTCENCEPFKIIDHISLILSITQYYVEPSDEEGRTGKSLIAQTNTSNPSAFWDFEELHCGAIYEITLRKGSGVIEIPQFIVSEYNKGDQGRIVTECDTNVDPSKLEFRCKEIDGVKVLQVKNNLQPTHNNFASLDTKTNWSTMYNYIPTHSQMDESAHTLHDSFWADVAVPLDYIENLDIQNKCCTNEIKFNVEQSNSANANGFIPVEDQYINANSFVYSGEICVGKSNGGKPESVLIYMGSEEYQTEYPIGKIDTLGGLDSDDISFKITENSSSPHFSDDLSGKCFTGSVVDGVCKLYLASDLENTKYTTISDRTITIKKSNNIDYLQIYVDGEATFIFSGDADDTMASGVSENYPVVLCELKDEQTPTPTYDEIDMVFEEDDPTPTPTPEQTPTPSYDEIDMVFEEDDPTPTPTPEQTPTPTPEQTPTPTPEQTPTPTPEQTPTPTPEQTPTPTPEQTPTPTPEQTPTPTPEQTPTPTPEKTPTPTPEKTPTPTPEKTPTPTPEQTPTPTPEQTPTPTPEKTPTPTPEQTPTPTPEQTPTPTPEKTPTPTPEKTPTPTPEQTPTPTPEQTPTPTPEQTPTPTPKSESNDCCEGNVRIPANTAGVASIQLYSPSGYTLCCSPHMDFNEDVTSNYVFNVKLDGSNPIGQVVVVARSGGITDENFDSTIFIIEDADGNFYEADLNGLTEGEINFTPKNCGNIVETDCCENAIEIPANTAGVASIQLYSPDGYILCCTPHMDFNEDVTSNYVFNVKLDGGNAIGQIVIVARSGGITTENFDSTMFYIKDINDNCYSADLGDLTSGEINFTSA